MTFEKWISVEMDGVTHQGHNEKFLSPDERTELLKAIEGAGLKAVPQYFLGRPELDMFADLLSKGLSVEGALVVLEQRSKDKDEG